MPAIRIAKTGSQALIALLVDLEEKNKFTANIDITKKGKEYTMEPPELVAKQVAKVQQMAKKPGVFIKHYNFVDFEEHKASVRPDFFAVVRNPIDRASATSDLIVLIRQIMTEWFYLFDRCQAGSITGDPLGILCQGSWSCRTSLCLIWTLSKKTLTAAC